MNGEFKYENDEDIFKKQVNLDDEEAKQEIKKIIPRSAKTKIGWCMCHHNAKAKNNWDLFVIFLALYNAVMIPFEFAFSPDYLESNYYWASDYIIDCIFFIDICITFRTTYINQKTGMEVSQKLKVAFWYVF